MSAARIGRIRLKSGGAEVRLIRREQPNHEGAENWAGEIIRSAKTVANHTSKAGPIRGFVLAAFYDDKSTYVNFRWGDESPLNRALLPSYIAEVIRRDLIVEAEAEAKFNEMFEGI